MQIGILFKTSSPIDTPRLMALLLDWMVQERGKAHLHSLIIVIFAVIFLQIHSFLGGDGRLSRVLTTCC